MARTKKADRLLFGIIVALVLFGFFIFLSASLGLLAREGGSFAWIAAKQFLFGVVLGFAALFLAARIDYRKWKGYALPLFVAGALLSLAVFIPGLGLTHGGATRWLDLGIATFQPAELLKLGVVIYLAALFSSLKQKIQYFSYGPVPLLIVLGVSGIVLGLQPDFGTLGVITLTASALFIAAGGRWKHLGIIIAALMVAFALVVFVKPYVFDRITTFIDPSEDPLGAGYQIQQSLIAVGSGEMTGRGFGQSIQKFEYLPEPTGDSIFAVAAEEFGFIGSVVLILLFTAFAFRGFVLSRNGPTRFGGLLILGLVILIISQSFLNIASMLGLFPLTGMPLLFVSQGGSALLFTLLESGIILSVSRYCRM